MRSKKALRTSFLSILLIITFIFSGCEKAVVTSETVDRAGNAVTLPASVNRVLTLAPNITQIMQSLGFSDKIVGIDSYSEGYLFSPVGDAVKFDMLAPDVETMLTLEPDIVFVTGMSFVDGINPYQPLIDAGICVVCIPSSDSLDGIRGDITFIAECMGTPEKATPILEKMDADIAAVKAIGDTITDKKGVMFEIAASPAIYSFGSGTFLNEMIEIIGAKNVFADQMSWIAVTDESAIAANPDVILTSVYYIDDPEGEILSRSGWEAVTAVNTKQVYKLESTQTDVPSHFVTQALFEMAKCVYPEQYAALSYTDYVIM
jgi:iron complex transport system substrate-binding protein